MIFVGSSFLNSSTEFSLFVVPVCVRDPFSALASCFSTGSDEKLMFGDFGESEEDSNFCFSIGSVNGGRDKVLSERSKTKCQVSKYFLTVCGFYKIEISIYQCVHKILFSFYVYTGCSIINRFVHFSIINFWKFREQLEYE